MAPRTLYLQEYIEVVANVMPWLLYLWREPLVPILGGRHSMDDLGRKIYLLTPWGRVLPEKLTGFAASQEIPRIFGTRRFITVLTSARHLSLS